MGAVTGLAMAIGAASGGVEGLSWQETGGGNVFEEHMPQEPDVAVSLASAGGPEPDSLHPYHQASVQVTVRGDDDPQTAKDLWQAVFDYLHGKRNAELPDGTYLVWCLAAQGEPIRIGADDNGRHRFTMNLRCEVRRPSTHRP